jgi:hypothetical protein
VLLNPCDLSVDLDETLFGFGRELSAGLDGRMERAATLNRLAPITESAAVLKLSRDAGSFSLQRCEVRIAAVLLDRFRLGKRLYERHGFEVLEPFTLPGGPPLYPMWREPS